MSWDDIIKGLRDEPKRRKPKHKVDLRQKHKQKLSTKGKVKETEEKKCPPGERWDDELEECISIEEWIKRQPSLEDMQWNSGNLTKWFNVLKGRGDVFFERDSPIDPRTGKPTKGLGGGFMPKSSDPRLNRSITLYMSGIKDILEFVLGRQPTDRELEEHVIQVLMHEAGHAAHENIDLPTEGDDKGWYNLMSNTKDLFQKEMVAYMTEYPDKPYYILLGLWNHGMINQYSRTVLKPIMSWLEKAIPKSYNYRKFGDGAWGDDLYHNARNRLLKLHWAKGKVTTDEGIFTDLQATNVPKTKKQALEMYGEENREFIKTLKLAGTLTKW